MRRLGQLAGMRRMIVTGVMGGCFSVLLFAAPAAAASSVSVSPSTVPSGGTVVISGMIPTSGAQSCPPGDAAIITSTAALFPPDGFGPRASRSATGAFRVSYTVPTSTPPGIYSIGLRCGGGNVGVHTSLRVTGQVQHIPTGAPPAGLGGASGGNHTEGWLVAGAAAAVLAGILAGATAWRRRRLRA
jgi:hypothetical protein